MDTTEMGQLTASLMEEVEEMFSEEDNATIRTVMITVEVDTPTATYLRTVCTDDRPWVMYAFMDEARDRLGDAQRHDCDSAGD